MKKLFSTLDIIVKKSKRDHLLRRYSFTFTFINYKHKFDQIEIVE